MANEANTIVDGKVPTGTIVIGTTATRRLLLEAYVVAKLQEMFKEFDRAMRVMCSSTDEFGWMYYVVPGLSYEEGWENQDP